MASNEKFYHLPQIKGYFKIEGLGEFLSLGDEFVALKIARIGKRGTIPSSRYEKLLLSATILRKVKEHDYDWLSRLFRNPPKWLGAVLSDLTWKIYTIVDSKEFDLIDTYREDKEYTFHQIVAAGRLDLLLHIERKYGRSKEEMRQLLLTETVDHFALWKHMSLDTPQEEEMWHYLFDNKYITIDDVVDYMTMEGWEKYIPEQCGNSEKLFFIFLREI